MAKTRAKGQIPVSLHPLFIEMFKIIADACDGGGFTSTETDDLYELYKKVFKTRGGPAFYQKLIDDNPFNLMI